MAERVAFINQKQMTLRKQLHALAEMVAVKNFDVTEAGLRLDRVRTLFYAYEELQDELMLLDKDSDMTDTDDISKTFYAVAAKVESARSIEHANANATALGLPMGNSTFMEKQRQLKLPVAELPKFSGDLEQWLSFKNTFKVMVDSRSDINNLVKFMYLKSCLEGEAANKINVYEVNEVNYAKAWKSLVEAYERKRILVSKHLDAILDIPKLSQAGSKDLSKLIDTTRQHVNMLELLEFHVPDYVVVRTLEKALPSDIRLKWEESLQLDAIPSLQVFYEFIGGVVFRLHTMERDTASSRPARGGKRSSDVESKGAKKSKSEVGSRALVTAVHTCAQCQGSHLIYRCPAFEKMTVQQRWDSIKAKHLCRNCLRKHTGDCTSKRCKQCNRFHHTLLHPISSAASTSTASSHTEVNQKSSGNSS